MSKSNVVTVWKDANGIIYLKHGGIYYPFSLFEGETEEGLIQDVLECGIVTYMGMESSWPIDPSCKPTYTGRKYYF